MARAGCGSERRDALHVPGACAQARRGDDEAERAVRALGAPGQDDGQQGDERQQDENGHDCGRQGKVTGIALLAPGLVDAAADNARLATEQR